MGKRQRQKVTASGEPGCQMCLEHMFPELGLGSRGEELTMETVMAVGSGSQEKEKHIETRNVSTGRGMVGPLVVKPT